MLKIENIDKVVGSNANGRKVIYAGDYVNNFAKGDVYYLFKIEKNATGLDYNKEHDIVLNKTAVAPGKYYMYNMGLEIATAILVDIKDMKTAADLNFLIRNVLIKTQQYYLKH